MKRALAIFVLLLAGCGTLDSPDLVHDLRVLAMRSEPAEQVFALPVYFDGGAVDGGLDLAAALAGLDVQPITVTTLFADPDGGGRSLHYQYAICAELGDGGRCDLSQPDAYALDEGDVTPDGGWAELSVTFTPKVSLLAAAVQADAFHGFDYLPVPVQLHLSAGSDEIFAYKRLVFSYAFAGQAVPPPNQNPYIPLLLLDGEPWSASAPPVLVDRRDYEVSPAIPDGGEEAYARATFEGGSIDFKESWRYSFLATAGAFSSFSTGGQSSVVGSANPTDSSWTPADSDAAQDVTYFVIVRDGRGGEGWTVRHARFAPTVPAK